MIDGNLFITIVPPIFAALIAYAIARMKSNASVRIHKAKLEAEVDGRAMEMVRSVMSEMKAELKAEISILREENKLLKETLNVNREEIDALRKRLRESSELQDAMKIEIASLKNTIQWYEKRLKETEDIQISGKRPD